MHKLTGALVGFAGIAAIHFESGTFSISPGNLLILLAFLLITTGIVLGNKSKGG